MGWLYLLLYLVLGIIIAYNWVPLFQKSTNDNSLLSVKVGMMILFWGVLIPLGVLISIPELLIKISEKRNKR